MIAPIEDLARTLARLPGLGRRSAARAALALLREPERLLDPLSWALRSARESVTCCSRCGAFTVRDEDPCALCVDPLRDGSVICVVEEPAEVVPEVPAFDASKPIKYRVEHGDGTLNMMNLKKPVAKLILDAFHMNVGDFGYSEDLNIFGDTDADAALLAISVMLLGDRTGEEFNALVEKIAKDLAADGLWDDVETRAEIADWVATADSLGRFAEVRENMEKWKISTKIPNFEKFIRQFWGVESGLGVCGSETSPVGTIKLVSNPDSKKYFVQEGDDSVERIYFVCEDVDGGKWLGIPESKVDFYPKYEFDKIGTVLTGKATGRKLVWDDDTLRFATADEIYLNKGCVSYNMDTSDTLGLHSSYTCHKDGWSFDSVNVITDPRNDAVYRTIKIGSSYWMADNLKIEYLLNGKNYGVNCIGEERCEVGYYYYWSVALDSAGLYSKSSKECGYRQRCNIHFNARGVCPEGWHIPQEAEWNELYKDVGEDVFALQSTENNGMWKHATNTSGFNATPAGFYGDAWYEREGEEARFWAATEQSNLFALYACITTGDFYTTSDYKDRMTLIRCKKN